MIEQPRISHDPAQHTLSIVDDRADRRGSALRFWGGVAIAVAAVIYFVNPNVRGVGDGAELILVLATAAVGAVMIAFAGRPKRLTVKLAEARVEDARIQIFPAASSQFKGLQRDIWFEEIGAVVFGMTRFPRDEGRNAPLVEAFSVCLRLFDGSVVPLIEATTDKSQGFLVARQIAETVGVPIEQTGLGV